MPSDIYSKIVSERLNDFRREFCSTSRELFVDPETGVLRHPGEFGTYREGILANLLRSIVPARLEIGTGFLINTGNDVSTQCDLVVFDAEHTPKVESKQCQRFFPVETVASIFEVKSVLTKTLLRESLQKLSRTKRLRAAAFERKDGHQPSTIRSMWNASGDCGPNQIASIIVCERFDFDCSELANEVRSFYESETDCRHYHNLVLSLEDGLLAYAITDGLAMFPTFDGNPLPMRLMTAVGDNHLRLFASYVYMLNERATIYYPELNYYLNEPKEWALQDEDLPTADAYWKSKGYSNAAEFHAKRNS